MFACQQEGVAPDLMCVAKGITGGYLPLAATLDQRAASTRASSATTTSTRPSSTATPTPATRSPAPPRSPRSTSSSSGADARPRRRPLRADRRAAQADRRAADGVLEVRRRGMMVGIELEGFPRRGALRSPGDARGPPARRDHPPARRRRCADAAARDQRGRTRTTGRRSSAIRSPKCRRMRLARGIHSRRAKVTV